MCLHLADVQQEHSISTLGKVLSVTVRWETAVGKSSSSYHTVVFELCFCQFFEKINPAWMNYTCDWKVRVMLWKWSIKLCAVCNVSTHFWMSQPCFPGLISSEDRVDCRLCPPGFSCDPATGTPSLCPPGQHSPEGVLKCLTCPVDSICTSGFPIKVTIAEDYFNYWPYNFLICSVACVLFLCDSVGLESSPT